MILRQKITIVFPAYNAERTLVKTYQALDRQVVDDIILVDDCSKDQTVEIAPRLDLHVICHEQNRGYGANQKSCYRAAMERGAKVVLRSGDLATVLRASMSAPGLLAPVEIDGRMLVDGGLVDKLPVDLVREMDVDVLIAVDVSIPLAERSGLESALDVTNQMIGIMVRRGTRESRTKLTARDVLVEPDLGRMTAVEFTRVPQVMAAGEAPPDAVSTQLATLSQSPERYAAYLAARARSPSVDEPLAFVRAGAKSREDADRIEAVFGSLAGKPLDLDALQRKIGRQYGLDRFESVDYRLVRESDDPGLEVDMRRKSWGPNFLRLGVSIEQDFDGGATGNAGVRVLMTSLNRFNLQFGPGLSSLLMGQATERVQAISHVLAGELDRTAVTGWDPILERLNDAYDASFFIFHCHGPQLAGEKQVLPPEVVARVERCALGARLAMMRSPGDPLRRGPGGPRLRRTGGPPPVPGPGGPLWPGPDGPRMPGPDGPLAGGMGGRLAGPEGPLRGPGPGLRKMLESPEFLEEDWFFEALTETYVPLVRVLDGLLRDGVDYRLTMTLSPTLVSMMGDALLVERYHRYLERSIDLAEREAERTRRFDHRFAEVARFYVAEFQDIRRIFREVYGSELLRAFRRHQDLGHLEIITCGATHGFFPLMDPVPQAVRAQVQVAARSSDHAKLDPEPSLFRLRTHM